MTERSELQLIAANELLPLATNASVLLHIIFDKNKPLNEVTEQELLFAEVALRKACLHLSNVLDESNE